jgi:hypothetical protein
MTSPDRWRNVFGLPRPSRDYAVAIMRTGLEEQATLEAKDDSIVYRFHARDLHLVRGPAPNGGPIHFVVTIDGAAPGASHGTDTHAGGHGASISSSAKAGPAPTTSS